MCRADQSLDDFWTAVLTRTWKLHWSMRDKPRQCQTITPDNICRDLEFWIPLLTAAWEKARFKGSWTNLGLFLRLV